MVYTIASRSDRCDYINRLILRFCVGPNIISSFDFRIRARFVVTVRTGHTYNIRLAYANRKS